MLADMGRPYEVRISMIFSSERRSAVAAGTFVITHWPNCVRARPMVSH